MKEAQYEEVLNRAEKWARKYYGLYKGDPRFWENHVQLVRSFSIQLAEMESADKQVVELGAVFHDTGKYKGQECHHLRGYEITRKFLADICMPDNQRKLILKCVLKHRTRFAKEDNESEVKIVQSADVLAKLFDANWQKQGLEMNREMLLYLHQKANQKINLECAKRIAEGQIIKIEHLLGIS